MRAVGAARPGSDLCCEHAALVRQLARLQCQLDAVLREHARDVQALSAQNLSLRAQQVLWRTGLSWGLGAGPWRPRADPAPPDRPAPLQDRSPEAQAVICQTGCAGHAHPWLAADGQCRRSGQPCERVAGQGRAADAASALSPR